MPLYVVAGFGCPLLLWDPSQEFVCDSSVFEECAPLIPVARMLDLSGFGDAVGRVEAAASNNTQEIKFLDGCLMWNDAAVCCGRIWLKCFVSGWSDPWKSLER